MSEGVGSRDPRNFAVFSIYCHCSPQQAVPRYEWLEPETQQAGSCLATAGSHIK
jgi:hypothetical protein